MLIFLRQDVRKAAMISSSALGLFTAGAGFSLSAPAGGQRDVDVQGAAAPNGDAVLDAEMGTIVLIVDNVRSVAGQVCFALFPEDGDLSEPETAVRTGCGTITPSSEERLKSEIRIVGVPFGSYALAVFHDKNGNNVLDTRKFLGFDIPTEDFGFSNNPQVGTSGPSLEDALFTVNRSFYGLGILLRKPPL